MHLRISQEERMARYWMLICFLPYFMLLLMLNSLIFIMSINELSDIFVGIKKSDLHFGMVDFYFKHNFNKYINLLLLIKEFTTMGRKQDKRQAIQKRRQDRKKDMQIKKKLRQKMGKGDKFKLAKQYVQYFDKFNKEIAVLRVKLRDVGGDGNCLFRTFADQIDGSEQTHKFMREEACRYMQQNEQFFKPFLDEDQDGPFDKYIKAMQKDGQWGGHLQIQALCECFKCVVVIHKLGLEQIVMRPMLSEPTFGVIHLGYFQHQDFEHYVSIRQQQDQSEAPAIQKLKFLNKNMYQHLLYQDQEQYMIQKQLEEMQIIEKLENEFYQQEENKGEYEVEEPYPGYPRNKKCKCGSKLVYKNCCFKEFQKTNQGKR